MNNIKRTGKAVLQYNDGFKKGQEAGIAAGYKEGHKKGFSQGKEEGFKLGRNQGQTEATNRVYPVAFSEGKIAGIKKLVTSIEGRMAEADGYPSRQTWAFNAQIPAFWLALLVENWEPMLPEEDELSEGSKS